MKKDLLNLYLLGGISGRSIAQQLDLPEQETLEILNSFREAVSREKEETVTYYAQELSTLKNSTENF